MNSWVIGLIIRLLEKLLTPELMADLKQKFAEWLWVQVQNPDTEIDDMIFRAVCWLIGVDPEVIING